MHLLILRHHTAIQWSSCWTWHHNLFSLYEQACLAWNNVISDKEWLWMARLLSRIFSILKPHLGRFLDSEAAISANWVCYQLILWRLFRPPSGSKVAAEQCQAKTKASAEGRRCVPYLKGMLGIMLSWYQLYSKDWCQWMDFGCGFLQLFIAFGH